MKMTKEVLHLENRRFFLAALVAFPLVLYSYSASRKKPLPALPIGQTDDFVIINGWVMLKQDIAEYRE